MYLEKLRNLEKKNFLNHLINSLKNKFVPISIKELCTIKSQYLFNLMKITLLHYQFSK